SLVEKPWTPVNRLECFTDLATILHSGRLELSPERTLRRDLLVVKKRTTQQGYTIHLPHSSDGRHADFAPALAAAVPEAATAHNASDMRVLSVGSARSDHGPGVHVGRGQLLNAEEEWTRFFNDEVRR